MTTYDQAFPLAANAPKQLVRAWASEMDAVRDRAASVVYASRTALAAANVPASVEGLTVLRYSAGGAVAPHLMVAQASAPTGLPATAYTQSADGRYWVVASQILAPDYFGGSSLDCAAAGYALGRPIFNYVGTYVPITFSGSDGEANWTAFCRFQRWVNSCGPSIDGAALEMRPSAAGLYPLTIWAAYSATRPGMDEYPGGASYAIRYPDAGDSINITGIAYGARGASNYPVFRGANQTPVTVTLATALPACVAVGFPVYLRNVDGATEDAEVASGAMIVEWVSADRLSFRGTVFCGRTADLASPASITNGGTWNSILSSTCFIPQVAFLWETGYTNGAEKAVTVITNAAPGVVTAPAHGYANGTLVRFAGTVPTQLQNRIFVAKSVTTNTFTLYNMNNETIDTTSFDLYASGGTVYSVTETLTGSSQEGMLNCMGGSLHVQNVRFAYNGWLSGNTGTDADTECVWVSDGGRFTATYAVFAGAGDKVIRTYGLASVVLAHVGVGGGGCQTAIYGQDGAHFFLVRTGAGQARVSALFLSGGTAILNSAVIAGCEATLVVTSGAARVTQAYPSRFFGSGRGFYAQSGSYAVVSSSTYISQCNTGLDGFGAATIEGAPTFGTNTTNSTLIQDGVGGTSSNKGNARWISTPTGNQALPYVFGAFTFGAGGSIAFDRGTATDTGGGVTIDKMAGRVTTQSLTTAAGASTTITVTDAKMTTTSQVVATIDGGSNTGGCPIVDVVSRASGSFGLRIRNPAGGTALNGTLTISYSILN